jgi:O-succinylbenzoic acid--CoA ligase
MGAWGECGQLLIGGRRDAVIVSGGKKIQPAVVEELLRATGEFGDVAVVGLPDAEWGERVVACYPAAERAPNLERVNAVLSGPMRPKQFIALADWPRNAQGKLNRAALRAVLRAWLPLSEAVLAMVVQCLPGAPMRRK